MAKKATKVAKVAKVGKAAKQAKAPKVRKERKKKDKNAPKRAISAFFFYQKTRRAGLKKEQPSLSHTAIVSTMSDEWRKMSDSAKTPYNKMAEADKVRAESQKKAYESKKKA